MNLSLSLTSFFLFLSLYPLAAWCVSSPTCHTIFRSRSLWNSLLRGFARGGQFQRFRSRRKTLIRHPRFENHLWCGPRHVPVNSASLTDLTIEGNLWTLAILSLHQVMDFLSRCPRLIRCRVEIRNAEAMPTQFTLLMLPHLKSLSIFEATDVTNMFNYLDLSVVHDIEYHTDTAFDSTKRPWLLTPLRKSGRSIQEFATGPSAFYEGRLY